MEAASKGENSESMIILKKGMGPQMRQPSLKKSTATAAVLMGFPGLTIAGRTTTIKESV